MVDAKLGRRTPRSTKMYAPSALNFALCVYAKKKSGYAPVLASVAGRSIASERDLDRRARAKSVSRKCVFSRARVLAECPLHRLPLCGLQSEQYS